MYDADGVLKVPFFRSGFNYDGDAVSRETALSCDPEGSVTQQQFRDECDINEIVRRFGLTGKLPENPRMPVSGDFTGISDYQSAVNMVLNAEAAFMEFPADVRERFNNDPQKMMEFISLEKNRDEAIRMGLVPKPLEKTRDVVQAVDELAAKIVPAK